MEKNVSDYGSTMEKNVSDYFWTDLQNLVCVSIALVYFICVIAFDLWGGCKKRAYWVPGKFLVLSALTIQALSYLDVASVSLSDNPNIWSVAILLGNHILIDNGRLIICVFMGYLLPGMAASGSKDQWGDVVALATSLFGNIGSELYFLYRSKYLFDYIHDNFSDYQFDYNFEYDVLSHLQQQPSLQIWYKASSLGTVVSVLFLLFLLASTIPTGSTIREILSQRIAAALRTEGTGDKLREEGVKEFEEVVFKSWLLAHACRPDYVVARSVMSSAAGVVVTLRIGFSLLKLKFLKYNDIVHYNDGLDQLRVVVLVIQFLFIFVGWIAICCRWVTALVYFPKSDMMKSKSAFCVEDFWKRRIMELRYGWQSQIADLKEEQKTGSNLNDFVHLKIMLLNMAQKYLPDVLTLLQSLLVYLGKFCWIFSSIVIRNRLFRRWLIRDPPKEFEEYIHILHLVRMPQESGSELLRANRKAIKQAKKHMKNGMEKEKECEALIVCIRDRYASQPEFEGLETVEHHFPSLHKMCWMMTAASYFEIIVQVFPELVDTAKNVLDQAADIMNFLDRVDIEEDEKGLLNTLGRAADRQFERAKESIPPPGKPQSVSEAKERIEKLVIDHKQHLQNNTTTLVCQGAIDVKEIAQRYSIYKVGRYLLHTIANDVQDLEEMERIIEAAFSNLIGYCVLQVKDLLEKKCIEWARGFDEDMLWKAVYIAGKVKTVLEKSRVRLQSAHATNA